MANPDFSAPNSDDKLWAGLGYTGIGVCFIATIIIFFLKKGESDYIKFHNLQALGVCVVWLVLSIALLVLSAIPGVNMLTLLAWPVFGLAFFGLWIYLMIVGFTGKDFRIPVLGDFIETNLMK